MARPHPALIELAAGRPVPPVDDLTSLLESAQEHRMRGLLWHEAQSGRLSIPREQALDLAKMELRDRLIHRGLWRSIKEVAERLEAHDLAVAVAKGVAAEALWYPAIGTRPTHDLDLMLRPADVWRAADVVRGLQPEHPLVDTVNRLVSRRHLQSIDVRGPEGTHIDLHFDILKWEVHTRQSQLIWDRCEEIESPEGGKVRALGPESSLILFLLHLNKDRFSYLLGYADVARLIAQEDLDWDFIDWFLRTEGLDVHLYLTLEAVFETLRLPVPAHATPTGWRAAAWRSLWPEDIRLQGDIGRVSHPRRQYWIGATARGRTLEAGGRWARRVFPPRELLDYFHPGVSGPYLWHLVKGRMRSGREHHELVTGMDDPATR